MIAPIADLSPTREGLAGLLHRCVLAGASVGFIEPFSLDAARAFWDGVAPKVEAGDVLLFVAEAEGAVIGTVQLVIGLPQNQPHRAEVAKLLVDPAHRRKGIARALMAAVETAARANGRTLLTLDTRTGDAAEPLYGSLGFVTVGVIPGYCIDAQTGALDGTTIMYKAL
ncbi:MAG: GNAT family N-acetyltransferase [Pseudomonadota bacterium]